MSYTEFKAILKEKSELLVRLFVSERIPNICYRKQKGKRSNDSHSLISEEVSLVSNQVHHRVIKEMVGSNVDLLKKIPTLRRSERSSR